jgi:hypothetical protein
MNILYHTKGDPEILSKKDNNGNYIQLPNNKKNQIGPLDISNDDAITMCINFGYLAFQRTTPNVNYPNGRIYLKAPKETYTDNEVIRLMQNEEINGNSCRKSTCYFVGTR